MNKLKRFGDFEIEDDIEVLCKKYNIKNYTINEDNTINVNGNVRLIYYNQEKTKTIKGDLYHLPLNFKKVTGDFICYKNNLITLEGCPTEVGGKFWCSRNKLTSLNGSPDTIGGDFIISDNQITSLKGAPKEVGGTIMINKNPLPKEILSLNYKQIEWLFKYQDEYDIWKPDNSLNKGRFDEMLVDMNNEISYQ